MIFDLEILNDFIESFRTRAINQGWFKTFLTFGHSGTMTNFVDNYGVVYNNQYKINHSRMLFVDKDLIKTHKTASVVSGPFLQKMPEQQYMQNKKCTQLHGVLLLPSLLDQGFLQDETQQSAEELDYYFSSAFWTLRRQKQMRQLVR